jgi:TrmH family RNA methyltransferase
LPLLGALWNAAEILKALRSRDNPFYKSLLKLAASSRARREARTTILDGVHLLEAYAGSGLTAQALIVRESAAQSTEIGRLVEKCPADHVYSLGDSLFDAVAQVASPTGIMALVDTPPPAVLPDSIGNTLLLEEIQDPGNLGSILRSAAAAGIRDVFLSKKSIFAWSPKVLRAGMGAHFSLSIHEEVDLIDLLNRREGLALATDVESTTTVYQSMLTGPVAWIFGNEGAGVSTGLMQAADGRVCIPMAGAAESINVAAAVAVCLFEQARQRLLPGP